MSVRRAQDERIEGTPDGLNAITEIMDVPDAPTIGTATDLGTGSTASVTFTAATTGGTATTYTVTSTPGSITGTGASSPITVSGLSVGTAYTFKVKGTNATGVVGPESVASNSLTLAFPVDSAYDALASVTIPAGQTAASVTFAGIPTGYKHLQLRSLMRSTFSDTDSFLKVNFNGDTGANYPNHFLNGNGTTAASYGYSTSQYSYAFLSMYPAALASASIFGTAVIDILDYANINKYKTVRSLGGYDVNGAGTVRLNSASWLNTNAITSISITDYRGGDFAANSSFALYGVK